MHTIRGPRPGRLHAAAEYTCQNCAVGYDRPQMLINDFDEKVELVRRYRAGGALLPARVTKALGAGYRVTLPLDGTSSMFHIKPAELPRLLAEFPGVTELWRLFAVN